jgi:hypothetical protein
VESMQVVDDAIYGLGFAKVFFAVTELTQTEGSWPPLKELGLEFSQLSTPRHFEDNPELGIPILFFDMTLHSRFPL